MPIHLLMRLRLCSGTPWVSLSLIRIIQKWKIDSSRSGLHLLGGQIKILQGAVPKIGEVDSEGIDRLYMHQTPWVHARDEVFMYQGMSFPMKNVIACIGTHGPSAIFNKMNLQQITCTGAICKIAKEGEQLLLLTRNLETSRRGVYAIGGSISPSHMEIQEDGTIREKKHSNLIYTAVRDGVAAMNGILSESEKG